VGPAVWDKWFWPDGLLWDGPYERPPGWGDIWDITGVAMLDDRLVGTGWLVPDGEAQIDRDGHLSAVPWSSACCSTSEPRTHEANAYCL
jgi:hypothetical protein